MTDQAPEREGSPDPLALSKNLADIAQRSQRLVLDFVTRHAAEFLDPDRNWDPLNLGKAFVDMTTRLMADPAKLAEAQAALWQGYLALWTATAQRLLGKPASPVVEPEKGDRRFSHPEWRENAVFDFIKQSYLLTSRWLLGTVRNLDGLDEQTAKKVDFYTRQFIDAMSPTNFVLTNPEVLKATVETKGENLLRGLNNLLEDLERGNGTQIRISMTDPKAFDVGRDLAATPGKVVFQNDLMQLIQYAPVTESVFKRPLLIVPPWINKYYILDLRPENSFTRWTVEQGHTVFTVSWVNPDERLAAKTFESYLVEGPLAALDVIAEITGSRDVNAIGYCLGGTLLAIAMAYLEAKHDPRVHTGTFFTTMIDFAEPGELGVFIDEAQLSALEARMGKKGYLEAEAMANTFNMLRANDLIWSFVVNNYLLGKDPLPFDLLYWNADSTRMPGAMHSFYLRKMYQENALKDPGGIVLAGVPIDIARIERPAYFLSTKEDHISPWKSTYAGARLFSGPVRFVLAASGHIAGVVNPPDRKKYCYWINPNREPDPDSWFVDAERIEGSWWGDWGTWIADFGGEKVAARKPGSAKYPPLEDAPGSYVRVRA